MREGNELQAEDALKAALVRVFEKAQQHKVASLAGLTICVCDKGDTLKDRLDAQFRSASDADGKSTFLLRVDPPLAIEPESLQKLGERIARVFNPAAHVIAMPNENI